MSEAGKPVDLRVNIASDGGEAALIVPADFPRDCITLSYCKQKLLEFAVEIRPEVTAAIEAMIASLPENGQALTTIVARKHPPVHGKDGHVQWLVEIEKPAAEETPAQESAPAAELAGVNHYENSAYITVKNGELLGRVIEPVQGTDGRDVTGRSLAAKVGRPAKVIVDESIMITGDGSIIAQADGIFHRQGNKAKICQVLEIQGFVDFSTGNIDFRGDVLIHKGVRDCFIVKASNHIEARGLIEAATIEAGGNLIAAGGMAGRERGTVRVGRDLMGRYLDNIKGDIGGDLKIDREIINCTLNIGGAIRMPNAAIIGGTTIVTGSAEVGEIGSSAGTPTKMVFGSVPALECRLKDLDELLKKLHAKQDAIKQEQYNLNANSRFLTASQKERACEISFDIHQVETQIEKAQQTRDLVDREIGIRRTVKFTVNRQINRNVVLVINDQQFRIDSETRGPLQIGLDATKRPVFKRGDSVLPLAQIATASMVSTKAVA